MRKSNFALLFSLILVLSSCSLDFLNKAAKDNSTDTKSDYTVINSDKTRMDCFDGNDALKWYELYTPSKDAPDRTQRYSAQGSLLWTYIYSYNSLGKPVVEAYYAHSDSGDVLSWFTQYFYDAATESLTITVNFDAASAQQWAEYRIFTASNKLSKVIQADLNNVIKSVEAYTYDASTDALIAYKTYGANQRLLSATTYAVVDSSSEPKPVRAEFYTGADSTSPAGRSLQAAFLGSKDVATGGASDLVFPTLLAAPTPPVFTPVDANTILDTYILWNYDSHGSFKTTLGADNYPTQIVRSDDRLAEPVTIAAVWDATYNRLISKTTSYGGTEVLKIGVSYSGNERYANGGWPVSELQFSGAGLLAPLRVGIDYNSFNVPSRITAEDFASGSPLYYLEYEYENSGTKINVDPGINLEPFSFAGKIGTIKNYLGDGKYLGEYIFDYSQISKLVISSWQAAGDYATSQNEADNGRFEIGYDTAGQAASFTSYNKNDGIVWQYQYTFADVQAVLDANAPKIPAMIGELGLTQNDVTSAGTTLTKLLSGFDANSILAKFINNRSLKF